MVKLNISLEIIFDNKFNNTKDLEVLLFTSFNPSYFISILKLLKTSPDYLKIFLKKSLIKNFLKDYFTSYEDFEFIDIILDDLEKHTEYLDPLIEIINNNNTIIDCIIQIIDINTNNETNLLRDRIDKTIKILQNLLIYNNEIFDFLSNFIGKYPELFSFLRIFKKILNTTEINIEPFINFLKQNHKKLFELINNILINFSQTKKLISIFSEFIGDNIEMSINFAKILYNNTKIFKYFLTFIEGDNLISDIIIFVIKNDEYLKEFLNIFINNSTLLENLLLVMKDIQDPKFYMKLPKYLATDDALIKITIKILKNFMNSQLQTIVPIEFIGTLLRQILNIYVNQNRHYIVKQVSEECIEFLNYTFLGYVNNEVYYKKLGEEKLDKNISYYYIYKFLVDTTKDRNDLLTYENCLDNPPKFKAITGSSLDYMDHIPTFIMSVVDLTNNDNIKKNFTYFDKYHFILGSCFAQGKNTTKNKFILKNGTQSYYHCNKNDYAYIMNKILKAFIDIEDITIEPIEINRDYSNNELSLKNLIPLFILIIPIFIYFFLILYRKISIRKRGVVTMINRNEEITKGDEEDNNNFIIAKKIKIIPKWFKLLNVFFNFKDSLDNLFNCDSNDNKEYLNNKGIIYIKGIIGISILLTILGQLYLIFFNLPMKVLGLYQFHELISNIAYVFLFIGLRYSPRVLFSCSGYTLTYKYLSFIEQGLDYYLIKFFFYHFYKYIILFLFVFFLRYSLYEIIFYLDIRPMWKVFDQLELKKPNELFEFFLNLFNLGSFRDFVQIFLNDKHSNYSHDLFDYYWMPFNEMFFYIFGIILITFGYKAKKRIDYVIICLIIIIMITKIIMYYIINKKKDVYTTLYYYIFDYGRIMLNPIFNLNYFLLGMYFGLINYSLQKGITQINKNNNDDTYINHENNNLLSKIRTLSFSSIGINSDDGDEDSSIKDRKSLNNISTKKRLNLGEENDDQADNFNENKRYSINDLNSKAINKNKKKSRNYIKEIDSMPFLISTVKIIDWHRKDNLNLFFKILLIFLCLFIIILSFLNIIFITVFDITIDNKTEDNNYNKNDKLNEKLLLENFIANPILNFIYLFDIELFVFFIQWGFFILYMKGHYFFIDFFSHIYWSFFTKSYFSFLIVCNPVILFIFYESETVVKLNFLNICLYYFINLVFIFIMTIIIYIIIDSPLKKISKYIVNRDRHFLNFEDEDDVENEKNIDDEEEKERIKKN